MISLTIDIDTYIILPLLIFLARIIDVSISTMKLIFISKGFKKIAPLMGFVEVLVWLLAITRIFENLDNWVCYIAFAGGFATGNFVGLYIEEKIALGVELIRIVTRKKATELIEVLRKRGYGITNFQAEGSEGEVSIIYSIINRKKMPDFVSIIKEYNPNAFYTIEDIRFVSQQVYSPLKKSRRKRSKYKSRL